MISLSQTNIFNIQNPAISSNIQRRGRANGFGEERSQKLVRGGEVGEKSCLVVKERAREREREVYGQSTSDLRSVSTTPCRVTPPLGARAQHLTASTIPPLSVWPCGTPWRIQGGSDIHLSVLNHLAARGESQLETHLETHLETNTRRCKHRVRGAHVTTCCR
jgi:hypothetical protein